MISSRLATNATPCCITSPQLLGSAWRLGLSIPLPAPKPSGGAHPNPDSNNSPTKNKRRKACCSQLDQSVFPNQTESWY
jgi:hypothetical protein